jgi:hypothetical protein
MLRLILSLALILFSNAGIRSAARGGVRQGQGDQGAVAGPAKPVKKEGAASGPASGIRAVESLLRCRPLDRRLHQGMAGGVSLASGPNWW